VSRRRAENGATALDPALDVFSGIYEILRAAATEERPHGGSRATGANPELLGHKNAALPTAKPTRVGLNKKMATAAWAWCVVWLRLRQRHGESSTYTDAPVEWLTATDLKVLCT
jgi:hypothetical protein